MNGKLLIVEDEPIVALDLQQEVEQFGCKVIGLAESVEEALLAVEECRPDLALMDIHIVGSMDGIQAARLLRDTYHVPVVFLTSYSDELTIARAAREMPYGYLTKPFKSRELKATLQVALHKAKVDEGLRRAHEKIATTFEGMLDGVLRVSQAGEVQFMNAAAERLTGKAREQVRGLRLGEVLCLKDNSNCPIASLEERGYSVPVEGFGLSIVQSGGKTVLVDFTIVSLDNDAGVRNGYVVTLRKAEERLRFQVIEDTFNETDAFDSLPTAMVQLDGTGHIVRVNQALLRESGVTTESLIGRTLTGLSMDPDPRIASQLMPKLLHGGTTVATARQRIVN
jgi:PAS domain S-box-containing protein